MVQPLDVLEHLLRHAGQVVSRDQLAREGKPLVSVTAADIQNLRVMPDGVVWLPANSPGSTVRRTLGVGAGAVVEISGGAA